MKLSTREHWRIRRNTGGHDCTPVRDREAPGSNPGPRPVTQGKTVEEAKERGAEAISVHIAGLEADGEPVPEEHEPPRLITVTVAA